MLKRYVIAGLMLAVMAAGCPGNGAKEGAERDISERPTGGVNGDETGGDADRPGDRDVTSLDEAIRRMQTIYFDFDKYNLLEDAKRALEINAEVLRENPGVKIMIQGHCDERGTNEYNLALGERRAKAARDYLVKEL